MRRQEAVRAGPGPGPAHTKCMGVMGVGIFCGFCQKMDPFIYFGVIFVYKILEDSGMGAGACSQIPFSYLNLALRFARKP